MHHPEADLDLLEALFLEQPPENDGMLLSEFDGFCAGLIVCPDMIPPSAWLSHVWGDDVAPSFDSLAEYQSALELIMAHYNRVARSLMPPSSGYLPVLEVDPVSGETMWELWVEGFERAMALRPDCWEAIVDSGDEEAAASVSLMLALHQISEGTTELTEDAIGALDEQAPALIPTLVETLNGWTKSRRRSSSSSSSSSAVPANRNAMPAGRGKVGRNDPCPCGSGRKYKRCCGAT
jgi:uncharacterized protein